MTYFSVAAQQFQLDSNSDFVPASFELQSLLDNKASASALACELMLCPHQRPWHAMFGLDRAAGFLHTSQYRSKLVFPGTLTIQTASALDIRDRI